MPPKPKNKNLAYGSLIVLECILWGIGNPLIKLGLESVPVFFFIFLRYFIAAVLFLIIFRRKIFTNLNRANLLKCLAVSVLMAATFVTSNFALMLTTATTAGFLIGISVLFTPFFSRIFLKKRIKGHMWGIILLVLAGMYLLCFNNGCFAFGAGEILAVISSALFACVLVLSSKYIRDVGPAALSFTQSATAAVLAFACSLIFEGIQPLSAIPSSGWAAIIYLAVFSTCIAFLLQNFALKHVSAVFSSLAFCTEPVFTAIASYFLLGEQLSFLGIIGACIVVAGTFIAAFLQ